MCTPSPFYSSFSSPYLAYEGGRNTEFSSKGSYARAVVLVNVFYLFVGQLLWWVNTASARYRIAHVVCLRSKYEMIRVYALWVVACMTNHLALWYATFMQRVGQACGANYFTALATRAKDTIPTIGFCAGPLPAFTRRVFNHFCPKSSCNINFFLLTNTDGSTFWRAVVGRFFSIRRHCKNSTACRACFVYHKMENTHVYAS